jgi:hypothetical protein
MPISNTIRLPKIATRNALAKLLDPRDEAAQILLSSNRSARAMLIYAFCTPSPGTRTSPENRGGQLSYQEFANLKLAGLTDPNTVAKFYNFYKGEVKAGRAEAVEPGNSYSIPNLQWRPAEKTTAKPAAVARRWSKDADLLIENWDQLEADQQAAAYSAAQRIMDLYSAAVSQVA